MNDAIKSSAPLWYRRPAAMGAALGAAFHLFVAIGLLWNLWGDDGWLVPGNGVAHTEDARQGYWIGRVMASPINLFSFAAFGAAVGLLVERRRYVTSQQAGFDLGLLGEDDSLLLPQDAVEHRKQLKHLRAEENSLVLVRLLNAGLQRARANWSAEDVGAAIKTQAEIHRDEVDADYSMVRYLAWAIPSIGFVGTVLGIGQAMGSIKPSGGGETLIEGGSPPQSPLTEAAGHLNTAFDTTFVALVLSLVLMYFLHRVQADEDRFLAQATDWCLHRLPFRMHIPKDTQF